MKGKMQTSDSFLKGKKSNKSWFFHTILKNKFTPKSLGLKIKQIKPFFLNFFFASPTPSQPPKFKRKGRKIFKKKKKRKKKEKESL
jgi:hypothetical protein